MRKNNYRLQFTQNNRWLAVLFFVFGLWATSASAQVFCTSANSAGTISGYTATYQPLASVSAGSAWYWTTTLSPGVTYTWSNCVSEGGTASDTYIRVYNASNVLVASGDDNCGVQPNVTYTPTAAGTYYVLLTQYSCGPLSLNQVISYKATGLPPAFCGTASYAANISGYTATYQTAPGVTAGSMYYWPTTLTVGPTYTWSNCTTEGGTSEDTYLRLYNSAGTVVASGDDICGVNARISYTPTVGGTYFVVLSHYSCVNLLSNQLLAYKSVIPTGCPGGLGTGVVNISLPYSVTGATTCGMVNDLTSANTTICGSSSYYGTEEVVYIFTPSTSGTYGFDLTSNSSWVGIMLYAGCPLLGQGGTCVTQAQSSGSGQSIVATLTAGVTYYLVVDQWPSPYCIPSYNLNIAPAVVYDACSSIIPIAACGTSITTTVPAGNGSINFAGWQYGKEIIYSYTAPTTGNYTITKPTTDSWFYYTDFYYKASSGGCNGTGWTYIAYMYTGTSAVFSMTAGTTYYFLVEEESYTSGGTITWTLDCPSVPYDPCAVITPSNACGVTNTTVIAAGTGSFALGPYAPPSKERIYTFTPASTSTFNITITSNSYGYYTDLFFKPVSGGCNNSGWTFINDVLGNGTSASFTLTGGVDYYIMLDEEYYTGGGTIQWSISCPAVYVPPPANDECTGAIAQTITCGVTATFSGTTAGATTLNDGAFTGYPVVWEKIILTSSVPTLDITYCGNTPGRFGNIYLNMVTDCPGWTGFFYYSYDQFTCGDGNWTIHFLNVPAGTYYIPVMGLSTVSGYMNTPGPYTINVVTTCPAPPPVNDDCANAIPIACGASVSGDNSGATDDYSAPDCAGFGSGIYKGMWYTLTPTVNSFVTFTTCSGASWDTYLKVYSGTCSGLTCVAYNDDNCGLQSSVTTPPLLAGQTYYILVSGYGSGSYGPFTLSATCTPSDCSGQPNPGNTLSSVANPVCGEFTLSLQYATVGGDITYQWESSLNGTSWTPIAGATNPTLTTGQSQSTYYHCVVTCPSNAPGISSSYQVVSNANFMDCYCVPVTYCGYPDIITNVTFAGINRSSLCDNSTNAHSTYTTPNPVILMAVPNPISVSTGGDVEGVAVWIDFDHSGSFDASEVVLNGYVGTNPATYSGNVTIPSTAVPGQTMMRVRCLYAGNPLTLGPCANTTYGETEDYWIQIVPPNAISNSPVCEGHDITLDAPTTGTAYSWTGPNGFTSTIKDPTISSADPTTMSGTYTVVVTTTSGSYTATVDVVVNTAPALSASGPAPFCEGTDDLELTSIAPTATTWAWTGPNGYTSSDPSPTITGTTYDMTGNYEVIITDPNGCRDSVTIPVTIYQLPNITLTAQALTPHICTGDTMTLLAENIGPGGFDIGGATYLWNTNETNYFILIASAGTYSVTGTDGNGCFYSDDVTVTESAPPPAPVIVPQGDLNLCSSDGGIYWTSVTLHTVNYSSSLTWNTGETTQDLVATFPYDFQVEYRDALGCKSASNIISTIANLASTDPLSSQVSSNAPGNITCAVPVQLTLAAQQADSLAPGYLGHQAQWKWYLDGGSCGAGTLVGTGASITVTPPAAPGPHTYYVRAEGICNTTNCASIVITVKDPSVAPTSASASVTALCAGDQTQLSVGGGFLGTGAQWKWYAGSCGGALVGIGANVTVNVTSTTTYYVRAEGDCNVTPCQSTATVTVNTPSTDPTSATSNAPVNGICLGGTVTLTVSGGTLGSNSVYNWYEDGCGTGAVIGTGTSVVITPAYAGLHSYYVRAEGPCNTTNCAPVSVLVGTASVEATSITSSIAGNSICTGNNITLTLNGGFLGTVAQWQWYSGSCGGTAAGTGTTITVNPAVTTTYYVRAEGSCNNTICQSIVVNVSSVAPVNPPPTIISAPNGICSGNGSTVIAQVVPGATYYSWSGPNGTTFDGNNPSPYITLTNSVQVTFGNLPNGISGYDICVFAGNGCGTTVTKCRYIRGRVQSAQTITGNASSCPNTTSAYSIVSLPGADSYTWTITGAATINGSSSFTTTSTTVNVAFGPAWTNGTLSVYGSMSCGYNGPAKTITIISTPVMPGVMSGPTLVCSGIPYVYSIAPVAGALSYNWSTNVPGASMIGAGTSRTITFPAVIPAGSTVSVTATGPCGTSVPRVKNIATGLTSAPGTISGPATGQCGQTGVGYSILPVAGATSYLWSATNGATINGANNITTASVDFPALFTSSVVSVVAINTCGSSAPQTKLVTGAPANPGVISNPGAVCVGQSYTYSVPGSTGANSYNWTSPAGSTILSGQGTAIITVLYLDNSGGSVSVNASNNCGTSSTSTLAVSVVCRLAQLTNGSLIDATLYPNPTTGSTTLKFETIASGDYKVSVVDMTGQIMQISNITAVAGLNMHELDMSTYAKGLYMVRLESEGEAMQMLRVTVE